MNKLNPLLAVFLCLMSSACSVTAIKKYNPNFKNTRELQKVDAQFSAVEVAGDSPSLTKILAGEQRTSG